MQWIDCNEIIMDTNWWVIVVIIQCWIGKLVIWFSGHSHFWSMGDNYLCEGPDGCINSLDSHGRLSSGLSIVWKCFFHSNRQLLRHFCPDRRCPISLYYESRPCVLSVGVACSRLCCHDAGNAPDMSRQQPDILQQADNRLRCDTIHGDLRPATLILAAGSNGSNKIFRYWNFRCYCCQEPDIFPQKYFYLRRIKVSV